MIKKIAYALTFIGLAISIYLTVLHYTGSAPACPEKGIINCENVLTSPYASILGIPDAFFGVVFFLAELLAIRVYFGKDEMIALNAIGIIFVLFFITAEFLVRSICIYCTTVHVCTLLLLIISIKAYNKPTSS